MEATTLAPNDEISVSWQLSFPVSPMGVDERGLLPIGATYYFVVRLPDGALNELSKPDRIVFSVSVPDAMPQC